MQETEEQKAAREAAERRWNIRQLAGRALSGIIQLYPPNTFENGKNWDEQEKGAIPQLSPEQITEIGLASYELAEATLQAIEMGEKAQADATAAEAKS